MNIRALLGLVGLFVAIGVWMRVRGPRGEEAPQYGPILMDCGDKYMTPRYLGRDGIRDVRLLIQVRQSCAGSVQIHTEDLDEAGVHRGWNRVEEHLPSEVSGTRSEHPRVGTFWVVAMRRRGRLFLRCPPGEGQCEVVITDITMGVGGRPIRIASEQDRPCSTVHETGLIVATGASARVRVVWTSLCTDHQGRTVAPEVRFRDVARPLGGENPPIPVTPSPTGSTTWEGNVNGDNALIVSCGSGGRNGVCSFRVELLP